MDTQSAADAFDQNFESLVKKRISFKFQDSVQSLQNCRQTVTSLSNRFINETRIKCFFSEDKLIFDGVHCGNRITFFIDLYLKPL